MPRTCCIPGSLPAEPVVEPLRRLAGEVMGELARARQVIGTRAEQLATRHARRERQLADEQEKLTHATNAVAAQRSALEEERCALKQTGHKIDHAHGEIAEARSRLAEKESELGERQAGLRTYEAQLNDRAAEVESMRDRVVTEASVAAMLSPQRHATSDQVGPDEPAHGNGSKKSGTAYRFRKLRRDAKRRIKGLS